jgi:hypothetical protein
MTLCAAVVLDELELLVLEEELGVLEELPPHAERANVSKSRQTKRVQERR